MSQITQAVPQPLTATDYYLGFEIGSDGYMWYAQPSGWKGEVLLAESLPQIRKRIWRWWHAV